MPRAPSIGLLEHSPPERAPGRRVFPGSRNYAFRASGWGLHPVETSSCWGLLIQTSVGSDGGTGRPRVKRSGWAMNAASRIVGSGKSVRPRSGKSGRSPEAKPPPVKDRDQPLTPDGDQGTGRDVHVTPQVLAVGRGDARARRANGDPRSHPRRPLRTHGGRAAAGRVRSSEDDRAQLAEGRRRPRMESDLRPGDARARRGSRGLLAATRSGERDRRESRRLGEGLVLQMPPLHRRRRSPPAARRVAYRGQYAAAQPRDERDSGNAHGRGAPALAQAPRRSGKRSTAASFCASGSLGLAFGPRLFGARPASAPASRARRHSTRCDECRPSRRRRAPRSPRSHASASSTIRRLYSAVNFHRLAFAVTSAGGRETWRDLVDEFTRARSLALYTKLRSGSCLTHVGREG